MRGVQRPRKAPATKAKVGAKGQPSLHDFIQTRDYTGALALLEFKLKCQDGNMKDLLMWVGYAAFHLGNYKRAEDAYKELLDNHDVPLEVHLFLGCCYFYQQMYDEGEVEALKGPPNALQNRLLFNICHRKGDEDKLMAYHQNLRDTKEDQLSLAGVHYLRSHHQEATDIYKRQLLENREDLALNVYVAMCYYKLDYYDVSLEILAAYLQAQPDSATAINLKACNHFRLYNGKAAEAELKVLADRGVNLQGIELIRHNMVVFSNGDQAQQILPGLVDVIPEARLNLVIYYLRHHQVQEAHDLIRDLEPATPQEYILKGVVHACIGQATGSREHLKVAQQCFQLVGTSAHECDTIPGRQCMASCFFLMKQFDDVSIYLNSIKAYMYNDDDFNWNYALCLASTRNYKGAEEALLLIHNEKYKSEYVYVSWLARCYIMNNNPRSAWELYLKMNSSNESFNLLQLIANDCYRMGHFLYSAKAFDVLERLDPDPEYWEGKRGACVGVFQLMIAGKESRENLQDVLTMVRNTSNPQVEYLVRIIKKWCKDNNIKMT
ncbi:TTC26 [Symbiodinium microadriaticum]|nr:TTC26 [Symbiodinium microadriaticum]